MRPHFLLGAVLALGATMSASITTPEKAAAFEQKLTAIAARAEAPASGQRTEVAGDELNAYLQLRYAPKLPAGVAEPAVTMLGQGRLSGRAIVDLDGIRKKSSGGWFDPAAYLTGRLPVIAVGTLTSGGGRATFVLESAEVSGIPVPKTLLQELVTYYTTSPELPGGFKLDQPFDLPGNIQQIDVHAGRATVIQ